MTKPDFKHYLLEGIHHFNSREFWEAHESWETIWLVAESEVEQFLQGLIQVAAAYHHVRRGTYRGASRLFPAGLKRLEAFPPSYCGIDRASVIEAAERHGKWLAASPQAPLAENEYPELHLLSDDAIAPPLVQW
jgi:predicted metal-dependent hydrolase